MKYYAHSKENEPPKNWQPLEEHLDNVANLAAEFAKPFGAEQWTHLTGLWHDLGKGTLPWQAFLRNANNVIDEFSEFFDGHPTHAAIGAQQLYQFSKDAGKLLSYCIAGHHGGLPNWSDTPESALESRLGKTYPPVEYSISTPKFPSELFNISDVNRFGFQLQFFVRMVFSCLVDADYLDTENSMDTERAGYRSHYPKINAIDRRFQITFNELLEKVNPKTTINKQRKIVLQNCLDAAKLDSGLFSLTVPTGGGKTLASLAFALKHAMKHTKERIIYVIPFTSIIEQNAKVFRDMLGDEAILEHHCNFISDDSDWKNRLASENWDAPIVVTTNVQFFNSFYANKPSKCRKLHNVANSVVIFDEVQAIPVEKMMPCIEVIKELSVNYGVTSVLCTATQPAIKRSEQFKSGLDVNEIISNIPALFDKLKRTEELFIGKLDERTVASKLSKLEQVLCIVNTRQQALDIFEALPDSNSNIHLSALMHPAHRTKKLNEIRQRLASGLPCRVVSTQLIEAGVDVDFPCVFRALTGIDSIAQAAGRCNRNGLSDASCKVFIFEFTKDSSCSFFRQASQSAAKLFDRFAGKLTSPECVQSYFTDFFWKNEQRMDSDNIISKCLSAQSGNIQFKDIAEFKMIKSATIPIIIALEESALKMVDSLRYTKHKKRILRKLQQYTVQIYSYQFDEIRSWLECPIPNIFVLQSEELYSEQTGLKCKPPEGQAFFG